VSKGTPMVLSKGTPMVLCVSHFVLFLKAFGQELLDYFLEENINGVKSGSSLRLTLSIPIPRSLLPFH